MRPAMIAAVLFTSLSAVTLGGCATTSHQRPQGIIETPREAGVEWRQIATDADQHRIDTLPARWTHSLAAVPRKLRSRVDVEGPLLDPAGAQPLPALPPGSYLCRLVRLGGRPAARTYKADFCSVGADSGKVSFTKQTGTNLPGGWLFPDGDNRLVLLATNRPSGAKVAPPYGAKPERDMVGVVERVGPFRWRLAMPRTAADTQLDVYELTPVPNQPS